MDKKAKKIATEQLEYYREHIQECPVDILRVLYAEKEQSENYLYDAYQDVGKKMFEYAEEVEKLKRQVDIKDEYLNMIYCLGFDYDGYEDSESLKCLIDTIVDYSKKAVKNDDKYAMYEGCGTNNSTKYYNILHEELPAPKED